jgi:hypothetical protein
MAMHDELADIKIKICEILAARYSAFVAPNTAFIS